MITLPFLFKIPEQIRVTLNEIFIKCGLSSDNELAKMGYFIKKQRETYFPGLLSVYFFHFLFYLGEKKIPKKRVLSFLCLEDGCLSNERL